MLVSEALRRDKPRVCEPLLMWFGDGLALATWQRGCGGCRARVSIPGVLVVLSISGIPVVSRVPGVSWSIARVAHLTSVHASVHPLRLRGLAIGVGATVVCPGLLGRRDGHIVVSLPHVSWWCTITGL